MMAEESMPPDSEMPVGTSLRRCSSTDRTSASRTSRAAALGPRSLTAMVGRQNVTGTTAGASSGMRA